MVEVSKLQSFKNSIKGGFAARVVSALVSGSLNQKVIVLLGLCGVIYAVYSAFMHLWTPLLIGAVGGLIVALAVRDFERENGRSPSP